MKEMIVGKPTTSLMCSSSYFSSLHIIQNKSLKTQNHHFYYSSSPSPLSTSYHLFLPSFPTQWNTITSRPLTTLRVRALKSRKNPLGDVLEENEDEGMFLPFGKMKEWLERKPCGFGEGKVYDTSIEDKLLEEMSLSRRNAQLDNLNLKNVNVNDYGPKKANPSCKETEVAVGVRVRIVNLPKKKNIHRDLKAAFSEFPGLISIAPAVSGNKKTKDPICKGIAFVNLKSEEDALRFVEQFSGQIVAFGKIQKKIKCQLMNSESSSSCDDDKTQLGVPNLGVELDADLYIHSSTVEDSAFNVLHDREDDFDDSAFDVLDDQDNESDDEYEEAEFEDQTEDAESLVVSELNVEGSVAMEQKLEAARGSLPSNKQQHKKVLKKKLIAKGRRDKITKLDIPGSAKRLKIKEKAVLTGVLSKYASNAASTSG